MRNWIVRIEVIYVIYVDNLKKWICEGEQQICVSKHRARQNI